MRTERVTFLASPVEKGDLVARAATLGVSNGEYVRLAVNNYGARDAEFELGALSAEVENAIPQMREDLEAILASVRAARHEIAAHRVGR